MRRGYVAEAVTRLLRRRAQQRAEGAAHEAAPAGRKWGLLISGREPTPPQAPRQTVCLHQMPRISGVSAPLAQRASACAWGGASACAVERKARRCETVRDGARRCEMERGGARWSEVERDDD